MPKEGSLAWHLRDENMAPPRAMAVKEVKTAATVQKRRLEKYEQNDPAAVTSGGKEWLRRQRQVNEKIFNSSILGLYKNEINHRVKVKEAAEKEASEIAEKERLEREEKFPPRINVAPEPPPRVSQKKPKEKKEAA